MVVQLGENPWILIGLITLELLFIIIPALIFSKLERRPFQEIIKDMGFQENENLLIKLTAGLGFGILFFFIGNYIIVFFKDFIVRNLFSSRFVEFGKEGAISTEPIHPDIIQLTIIIILNILIIGPCEEAFFRGFLIKKFKTKLNLIFSIILSSLIFTLYHVPPILVPITTIITYSGYYLVFGVLLSLIFVYFEYSIIPCSIAHSCFNILILLI
ncbi:MAG: lysostaphin resistance A-like protein [Candidatus Odinarchaeota archaeon]